MEEKTNYEEDWWEPKVGEYVLVEDCNKKEIRTF